MKRLILPCLCIVMLLSGCWDLKELEHDIYITALGIDFKDDQMHVYIKTLPLHNIGKTEGGGGDSEEAPVFIGHGIGDSFDSASDNIYFTSQHRVSWSHIEHIIFSTKALEKKGLVEDVMDVLNRYAETRSATWMYGTTTDLAELFQGKPILDLSPYYSKENNPLNVYKQFSFVRPKTIREFLIEKYEPGNMVVFPIIDLNTIQWQRDSNPHPIQEWSGLAVMDFNSLKGTFTLDEMKGIRWMQPSTQRSTVFLKTDGSPYLSFVANDPKVDITPELNGGIPHFTIKVTLTGMIIENPKNIPVEKVKEKAEKAIEGEIRSTYMKAVEKQADIYHLGYKLFKKFPKEFKEQNLGEQDWLTENTIESLNVEVTIQTGGKVKLGRTKFKEQMD
ncbi:Ger(x)C family spore germination protein [Pontibacillus yanchengensis]|uniref:Ger(X)C family spore germination protein n=1 Tax=Pontibacillus yanchengensis TaxID=462910 RepID=A0ACC7VIA3_9BACI|nr:Ger(x)C family spore germination protein [Pontibacillus yanchengensis]MYL54698.1 Ger(x)C family spore germination protein [Pontibacillus yanchengensis]